jgi:hypothetical protein
LVKPKPVSLGVQVPIRSFIIALSLLVILPRELRGNDGATEVPQKEHPIPLEATVAAITHLVRSVGQRKLVWFLCCSNPDRDGDWNTDHPRIEAPRDLLELARKACPQIFPLAEAEPDPPSPACCPAVIYRKGTKIQGRYLMVNGGKEVAPGQFQIVVSFYAGSLFGAGWICYVEKRRGRWVVLRTDGAFES